MQNLELLAPARDAEIGMEAFRHGADAVYIGAPRFGARAAAGNSLEDIERLATFGHQYGARTIVAFNTILKDSELEDAQRQAWQLYEAGVDALIIQDLGVLKLDLPPIPLHASTQTDNRTIEKVRLMHQLGFTRVVVARELSIEEIRAIHEAVPDVELECFVHGALCVCVSGQCYMSAALTGRSANRGECAQPCRLPMDLLDAKGRPIVSQKHLLSLRDMNRSAYLAELINAGVSSFKIEGRLKDKSYVKNVVAYYRKKLDEAMQNGKLRSENGKLNETGGVTSTNNSPLSIFHSSFSDRIVYTFEPNPEKSFNRGFTSYFANGEREVMWNFDSPKSMGEGIGVISEVGNNWFRIRTVGGERPATNGERVKLNNGDGLVCDKTIGFRANRIDDNGRIFPLGGPDVCRQLRKGMEVRRNLDVAFEQLLEKPSAERRVALNIHFVAKADSLELILSRICPFVQSGKCVISAKMEGKFEKAQKNQVENFHKQLSKLGDTLYFAQKVEVEGGEFFVPSSMLSQLRREAIQLLDEKWKNDYKSHQQCYIKPNYEELAKAVDGASILPSDFKANVLNNNAREIFRLLGIPDIEKAFENQPKEEAVVMQTKHCLRMALGMCPKYPQKKGGITELSTLSLQEPWSLRIGNEKFILKFGCKNLCVSEIFRTFAHEK